MYSESISELDVNPNVAKLLFQSFQRSIHLPLSFTKATQVIVQTDVRLAATAHDCFTVANLAEKRSCPEITAGARDVNTLAVEIDCHFDLLFLTAGVRRKVMSMLTHSRSCTSYRRAGCAGKAPESATAALRMLASRLVSSER
jgi:hypothetical protein